MSFLDNLKDQGKAGFNKISEKVRESEAYVQLEDRYQNLSPSGQKMAKVGAGLVLLLIVGFIPFTKLSSSYTNLTTFEEKRNLIRDLFKTYRESSSTQNVATPPPADSLKFSIDGILQRAELLPEQKVENIEVSAEGRLIPANLISNVYSIKLSKLNLRQIVDIGASLVSISESVKMKDVTITANVTDTRYYDVNYKLYSLKVPEMAPEPMLEPEPKKTNRGGKKNRDSEDSTESSDKGSDE